MRNNDVGFSGAVLLTLWTAAPAPLVMVGRAQPASSGERAPTSAPAAFEVVSLKHVGSLLTGTVATPDSFTVKPAGKVDLVYPLNPLLKVAFGVDLLHIIAPEWSKYECYQVIAIPPSGTKPELAPAMLQTMLAERLGLKWHFETRQTDAYALVLGRGPLKITPSTEPLPPRWYLDARYYKQISNVFLFAKYLTVQMDREVIDFTGLQGNYLFNLDWSYMMQDGSNWVRDRDGKSKPDPSVLIKVVKTAGLALEPRKLPIKFLVIDHVDKEPTPN